jgi:hypothetical protein
VYEAEYSHTRRVCAAQYQEKVCGKGEGHPRR